MAWYPCNHCARVCFSAEALFRHLGARHWEQAHSALDPRSRPHIPIADRQRWLLAGRDQGELIPAPPSAFEQHWQRQVAHAKELQRWLQERQS